jgi:hypothetical protein
VNRKLFKDVTKLCQTINKIGCAKFLEISAEIGSKMAETGDEDFFIDMGLKLKIVPDS